MPFLMVLLGACNWAEETAETCNYRIIVEVDRSQATATVKYSNGTHTFTGEHVFSSDCQTFTVELLEPATAWFPSRTATLKKNDLVRFEGYSPLDITGSITWSGQGVPGLTLTGTSETGPTETRSRQAMTGPDGAYAFDGPMYGDVTLLAPATIPAGRVCHTETLGSCRNQLRGIFRRPVHFEVLPPTPTTILGSVTVDGMPLGGVTVTFGGPRQLTTTTDAQGNYRVSNLAQGSYTVSISGFGTGIFFTTTTRTVDAVTETEYRADFPGSRTPPNQPPVVTITAPSNGAIVALGTPLTLTGSADDPEDGVLTGAALAWSSSRDGALGTGTSVTTASLSAGTHTITLTATDSRGARGTASVSITVAPAGMIQGAVTLYGMSPLPGVTIQVTGNGVSRTTTSDANGAYAFAGLLPGTYTVTAIAPSGITFTSSTATVTVVAGQTATANFDGHYSLD